MGRAEMKETLVVNVRSRYEEKERAVGPELMLFHQRMIMLQIVDTQWKDHLFSLDHLKEGIGLRGYGQRDPLVEYKKESFSMFQALMDRIDEEVLRWIFLYQPVPSIGDRRPARRHPTSPRPSLHPAPDRPRRPAPLHAAAPVREPELALAGARALPRNLSFNDPSEAPSAFARAERPEAEGRRRRGADGQARGQEGGPERPLPLRQREEVQEVPWGD